MTRSKYQNNLFTLTEGTRVSIVANAEVTVYEAGTTDPLVQVMYEEITGPTALPNPFITDEFGNIELYLDEPQRIKLKIVGVNLEEIIVDYEPVLSDPASFIVNNSTLFIELLNGLSVTKDDDENPALDIQNLGSGGAIRVLDSADNESLVLDDFSLNISDFVEFNFASKLLTMNGGLRLEGNNLLELSAEDTPINIEVDGSTLFSLLASGRINAPSIFPTSTGKTLGDTTNSWFAVYASLLLAAASTGTASGSYAQPTIISALYTQTGISWPAINELGFSIAGLKMMGLFNDRLDLEGFLEQKAVSKPGLPASGRKRIWTSSDGNIYALASNGGVRGVATDDRSRFIERVLDLLGDALFFYIPLETDTTTSTGESIITATINHSATLAGRLNTQGVGQVATYSVAASHLSSLADSVLYSIWNGATDLPFTVVYFAKFTNTGASQQVITKFDTVSAQREWLAGIQASGAPYLQLYDESVDKTIFNISNTLLTYGSYALVASSYPGGGGATAATNIVHYINGAGVASTPTNDALFVATEDTTSQLLIGGINGVANMEAQLGMIAFVRGQISGTKQRSLYKLCKWYYGV